MVNLGIIRTAWSGTTGGPGLTQIAFRDLDHDPISAAQAQSAVDAMRVFWVAVGAYIPDEIVLTVSPVIDSYDLVTGELEESVTAATPPASLTGSATQTYSMAAGFKVNLNTGVIRNGRRVRGGIYVVPAAANAWTTNGLVLGTARTAVNNAGNTFRTSLNTAGCEMLVWSRPIPEGQPNGPRTGDVAVVSAFETNEKTAVLRGRRD